MDRQGELDLRHLIAADLAKYRSGRKNGAITRFILALIFVPGFPVIFCHRISRALYGRGRLGRFLCTLVWRWNVRHSSCHISFLSRIGPGLCLPHSTGVVIGDNVTIGANVTIYQHVTIGTRGGSPPEYPTIGDDVIIYPGAVIVGGIIIGSGARVGANSFVAKHVLAGETVAGVPARIVERSLPAAL